MVIKLYLMLLFKIIIIEEKLIKLIIDLCRLLELIKLEIKIKVLESICQ